MSVVQRSVSFSLDRAPSSRPVHLTRGITSLSAKPNRYIRASAKQGVRGSTPAIGKPWTARRSGYLGSFLCAAQDDGIPELNNTVDYKNATVRKLTGPELNDLLLNDRTMPVVVDFYATWCGPCLILAQELERLALEYADRVQFVKVDTDEEYELASQLQIRGLPTMVFLSHDKQKTPTRVEGLYSSETIRDLIEEQL